MSLKTIDSIPLANLRNVSVPLAIEQIKEFFENKELFFLVDYGKSKIKGNMFLTYLSNLDLPFEIVFTDATKQEKYDLLKIFMETRNQSVSDVLRLTAADIVLRSKGLEIQNWLTNPLLTPDECLEFIELNKATVDKWNIFLSSLMVFLVSCFSDLEAKLQSKEVFPHIKDPNYVGGNIVMLFDIPGFLELYFSVPCNNELFYFDSQFEEHMFKGKNLFNYFNCPENTLLHCANGLINQTIDSNTYQEFLTAKL